MLGAPVRPDPFPAMRLPGHSPGPQWWPRFFHPIRRLLFDDDVPTGPYGEQSTLTTSRPIDDDVPTGPYGEQSTLTTSRPRSGIGSDPPDATHREKPRSGDPRQASHC